MVTEIGSNFSKYDLNAPARADRLWWESDEYNRVFFKSGRNALKAIARKLKGEGHKPSVLLPIYTCETVITPFLDEGWEVDYYGINADLSVNFSSVAERVATNAPAVILFHSYFGLDTLSKDTAKIEALKDSGLMIIEDMTQSIFSLHRIESADYYVTSLRKFLAIPDGGCIFSKRALSFADIAAYDERIAPKAIEAFDLKNEYFIADLIGLRVTSDEGEDLGEIEDVLQTGANDVYVVKSESGEEILFPAIKECIKEVDIEAGTMLVHVLPGLRELNEK